MSESTLSSEPALQFDHHVSADGAADTGPACAGCNGPIATSYYQQGADTLCAACGAPRQLASVPDRRVLTLGRAAAFGFGAAIVGAVAYWAVMKFLGLEIGIVAIAIGFLVGKAVARATKGRSARRHRILAVALTWFAVGMAYTPLAMEGMSKGDSASTAADSTASASRAAPAVTARKDSAATPAGPASSAAASDAGEKPSAARGLLIGLAALIGLPLALPLMYAFSSMPGGLLSLLIIGFGLRQAWQMAAADNAEVTGPFRVGDAPAVTA